MKTIIISLSLIIISLNGAYGQSPVITNWLINYNGAYGEVEGHSDTIESNVIKDQYDSNYVYITCNCIPGYNIGPWTGNPNWAKSQNFCFRITRNPAKNNGTPVKVGLGHIGVWKNGVSLYNAWDGHSYNNLNIWDQNAFHYEASSFDTCLGHPDQGGEYHHHVNPKCLYNDADSTRHSPIIGWAFDGFPIYGAYGYANPNGSGGIKRMASSYKLRTNMVNRDTLPDSNSALSPSDYGPPVSPSYPLGSYLQDYVYDSGSGDLDSHNGRFCVTPEYPGGIYAYFVTIDASLTPVYPYTLGLTYYGTVPTGNTGPGSGHNSILDSTKTYTGIRDIKSSVRFQVEPNPVTDRAYIYILPESDNNIYGELVNMQGQVLKTFANLQPTMSYSIDFTSYPAGVYFLNFHTAGSACTQKIVKVK